MGDQVDEKYTNETTAGNSFRGSHSASARGMALIKGRPFTSAIIGQEELRIACNVLLEAR